MQLHVIEIGRQGQLLVRAVLYYAMAPTHSVQELNVGTVHCKKDR